MRSPRAARRYMVDLYRESGALESAANHALQCRHESEISTFGRRGILAAHAFAFSLRSHSAPQRGHFTSCCVMRLPRLWPLKKHARRAPLG
jgi:hypothetical protein